MKALIDSLIAPKERWSHRCHEACIFLIATGKLTNVRIARGVCNEVPGQHSWLYCGSDPYALDVKIIDPTLWSYTSKVRGTYVGGRERFNHKPFGTGSIFEWGRPPRATNPADVVHISPSWGERWSNEAEIFLQLLGPLDLKGWQILAHAPMQGWPSREIIAAMAKDKRLRGFIPIDIVGMNTDLNPSGLYPRS